MKYSKTQLCVKLETLLILMLEENTKLWATEIIQSEPQRGSSSDINEKITASITHRCIIRVPKEKAKRKECVRLTYSHTFFKWLWFKKDIKSAKDNGAKGISCC